MVAKQVVPTLERCVVVFQGLPRAAKRIIVGLGDVVLCVIASWVAFALRLGEIVSFSMPVTLVALASVFIAMPVFAYFGLYRAIFRHVGSLALLTVAKAILVYAALFGFVVIQIGMEGVPRTVGVLQPILLLLLVGGYRLCARLFFDLLRGGFEVQQSARVLIYGAGDAGRRAASFFGKTAEWKIVGFVDDDDRLHGQVLNGLRIYSPDQIKNLKSKLGISQILLALPSVSRSRRNAILANLQDTHLSIRTLPSLKDVGLEGWTVSEVKELDIFDLLGREPVVPNQVLLSKNIHGKTVMVTGAGGSIGGELCRQIVQLAPSRLILLEQSEFALYSIYEELTESKATKDIDLVPVLASVCDRQRLDEVFASWQPSTIYHAAAYKHVPLVEYNPSEGLKNNVFGTLETANAAEKHGVSDFVLISSDKAVRPTNIMGASKRIAEMVLQAMADRGSGTKFTMVRFGNVLGSSGSVVPKFRKQIRAGGPVTVTHPDVNRFFMTTPEASQLVIQAGAMTQGGDVFVLDMGEPVKIINLAKRMINLSGLTPKDDDNPNGEIEIQFTGLRPGEKLHEELLIGSDTTPTAHDKITRAQEGFTRWAELSPLLEELQRLIEVNDVRRLYSCVSVMVELYTPNGEIVDKTYLASNGKKSLPFA